MMSFVFTLFIVTFSRAQTLPVYDTRQYDDDPKCSVASLTLPNAHRDALYWLKRTRDILKSDYSELKKNKILKGGLKAYFRLDIDLAEDEPYIRTVISHIQKLTLQADNTQYKCHLGDISILCVNHNLVGFVPPGKRFVHLCKTFFTTILNDEYRSVHLLHEWSHLWGDKNIDYLNELYCWKFEFKSKASIVRQADQYAYFIYWMSHEGKGIPCRGALSLKESLF